MGWRIVVGPSCEVRGGLWAGTEEARAEELIGFLRDPSIDPILAGRGGVGCLHLLPFLDGLDEDLPPRWIVGRSDLTALHLALWGRRGWVGLSGPMAATDWGDPEDPPTPLVDETLQILGGGPPPAIHTEGELRVVVPGRAEGMIVPANLSLLASMVGTGYLPSLRRTILVLEEINEPLQRIDRMLTQLADVGRPGTGSRLSSSASSRAVPPRSGRGPRRARRSPAPPRRAPRRPLARGACVWTRAVVPSAADRRACAGADGFARHRDHGTRRRAHGRRHEA